MHPFARWTLAVVGLTLALSVSAAQDPNDKAIGARQSVMKLQSWYAGPLFQMAQGKMEYDAEIARSYAANLNTVANVDGGAMWPQGTDNGAYAGKTRALPEIWSTYPAVADKGQALSEAAAALAEVAGDGSMRCARRSARWARPARAVTTTFAPSRSNPLRRTRSGSVRRDVRPQDWRAEKVWAHVPARSACAASVDAS